MKQIKGETILNWCLIILGIGMIIISVFYTALEGSIAKKVIEVIGDIGIGLFPTGAIGLLINWMQARENEKQQKARRSEVLRRIDSALHRYLVSLCKEANKNYEIKGKTISEIIDSVGSIISFSDDESDKLKILLERLEEYFDKPDPVFIMTDCFTEQEQRFHLQRINECKAILNARNADILILRSKFLSQWRIAWKDIPEYCYYESLKYDGDNLI